MVSQDAKMVTSDLLRANEILADKEKKLQFEAEELKKESRKKWILTFFLLFVVLFLVLGLVYSVFLVSEETRIKSKAESSSLTRQVELANSYLFASPLKAKAGSKERIRITVFLLDSKGLGVAGKRVVLGRNRNLEIEEVQAVTDDVGKALFDVSSVSPNVYLIEASVDNKVIPQRVSVTFE